MKVKGKQMQLLAKPGIGPICILERVNLRVKWKEAPFLERHRQRKPPDWPLSQVHGRCPPGKARRGTTRGVLGKIGKRWANASFAKYLPGLDGGIVLGVSKDSCSLGHPRLCRLARLPSQSSPTSGRQFFQRVPLHLLSGSASSLEAELRSSCNRCRFCFFSSVVLQSPDTNCPIFFVSRHLLCLGILCGLWC